LLQDWQMQAMQHAAVAANVATQNAAGNEAAAASGGTAGMKRRGRPSNAEKSSAAAATAAAHSKRARNAGRCVVSCKHGVHTAPLSPARRLHCDPTAACHVTASQPRFDCCAGPRQVPLSHRHLMMLTCSSWPGNCRTMLRCTCR
jgi:hypothetical protein